MQNCASLELFVGLSIILALVVFDVNDGAHINIDGIRNLVLCEIHSFASALYHITQGLRVYRHYNSPRIYSTIHIISIEFATIHLLPVF